MTDGILCCIYHALTRKQAHQVPNAKSILLKIYTIDFLSSYTERCLDCIWCCFWKSFDVRCCTSLLPCWNIDLVKTAIARSVFFIAILVNVLSTNIRKISNSVSCHKMSKIPQRCQISIGISWVSQISQKFQIVKNMSCCGTRIPSIIKWRELFLTKKLKNWRMNHGCIHTN